MTMPSRTPGLPVRLLTHPEMVAACRVRDFSRVFHMVKVHAGIYPSMIARRCDLTPSRVGEIMAGRRTLTHMDVIERVSDGLRIPGHLLGLARREWETPAALLPDTPSRPGTTGTMTPSGTPAAAFPGADLDSILAVASGTSPATLPALQSFIADYWRRDDEHGGEALRPAVLGQLRYVVGLIKDVGEGEFRDGLFGIAAELARLTGWTYFDARQYSQARTYFSEALRLAKAVHDEQFMANVLASMSLQATYQDRPADALALVAAAQDTARRHSGTPRVMSMLSMREAFAHATTSDHTATHLAIAEAHRQFERISGSDHDPPWVQYFNEPKLIVDTGIAHGQLGEADAAETLITQAIRHEDSNNQRGRAFHTFWLARTQLQRGKLDQACHTATTALETASVISSERVRGHLREFHGQLEPYRQAPAAVAFDVRLREMLR